MTPDLCSLLQSLRAKIKEARARLESLKDGALVLHQVTPRGLVNLTPAEIQKAEAELAEAEQTLARCEPYARPAKN